MSQFWWRRRCSNCDGDDDDDHDEDDGDDDGDGDGDGAGAGDGEGGAARAPIHAPVHGGVQGDPCFCGLMPAAQDSRRWTNFEKLGQKNQLLEVFFEKNPIFE